ncbi:hypothetical protein [[Mycoplasma] testudinis]|uniref:hypothetical protein n=1 Tax=[Mycoplasma] testudinis TaxID=33924 RepID=UPI000480DADF|nr:hypothetical protein [[Mycoplasma] testudinis]
MYFPQYFNENGKLNINLDRQIFRLKNSIPQEELLFQMLSFLDVYESKVLTKNLCSLLEPKFKESLDNCEVRLIKYFGFNFNRTEFIVDISINNPKNKKRESAAIIIKGFQNNIPEEITGLIPLLNQLRKLNNLDVLAPYYANSKDFLKLSQDESIRDFQNLIANLKITSKTLSKENSKSIRKTISEMALSLFKVEFEAYRIREENQKVFLDLLLIFCDSEQEPIYETSTWLTFELIDNQSTRPSLEEISDNIDAFAFNVPTNKEGDGVGVDEFQDNITKILKSKDRTQGLIKYLGKIFELLLGNAKIGQALVESHQFQSYATMRAKLYFGDEEQENEQSPMLWKNVAKINFTQMYKVFAGDDRKDYFLKRLARKMKYQTFVMPSFDLDEKASLAKLDPLLLTESVLLNEKNKKSELTIVEYINKLAKGNFEDNEEYWDHYEDIPCTAPKGFEAELVAYWSTGVRDVADFNEILEIAIRVKSENDKKPNPFVVFEKIKWSPPDLSKMAKKFEKKTKKEKKLN